MEINELLKLMIDKQASDLHMKVPSKPVLRIDGVLMPQEDLPPLDEKDVEMAFERIANPTQRSIFLKEKELDFAYSVPGLARFRVSIMRQRGTISINFRMVPFDIKSIHGLELPQKIRELIIKKNGLVLVTGPAGSGKSTTMSAIINYINQNERRNIITIENTIEYLHKDDKSIIAQRDIGDDTQSFATALKHAQRHDPDVIVVGEMHDADTISNAIDAAEIGNLVIGILNSNNATKAIDIVIEIFPLDKQTQIRMQLSRVIEAVISQKLLTRINGGRVAAFEILTADDEFRRLMREAKTAEMVQGMESSRNGTFHSLDRSIEALVENGTITTEEALSKSNNPQKLKEALQIESKKSKVKV